MATGPIHHFQRRPIRPIALWRKDDDDDDDNHQMAGALDHLRVPACSLMMCTGYALQKQDSKLGRESRLSRLRLENQARFMQLEEKKSGDDSDHHPQHVYNHNYNNEVSEHSTSSTMLRDVSERTTQDGSEGIEVVPRRRRTSYTAVGAAQQVDRRPSISNSSAFFLEDPGDIPLDEVDEPVPPPPPPPPQQHEEEDVPLDEIRSSLVLLHEQEDSPMDEVDDRIVPTTTATTTYGSRQHVHKIHEDDVPLDEVDHLAHDVPLDEVDDLAPAPPPPQRSNGDKNPSSASLDNTSIESIPLDEVDELLTPPRQPRPIEEEEAETRRRLLSEDNSSNNEDAWMMTNPEICRSAVPTDELIAVRTPPRQQQRALPPPPQRQQQQQPSPQDGMVTFDASTNVFEQNRLSSSSWAEQQQQQQQQKFLPLTKWTTREWWPPSRGSRSRQRDNPSTCTQLPRTKKC